MKALVAYDSYFGNTEQIARAIGDGLSRYGEVRVARVTDVQPEQLTGLDLLVVGSATRKFSASPATMALVKSIQTGGLKGVKAAAFDTRATREDIEKNAILKFFVRLFGYAAEPIARQLRGKGATLAAPAEGFFVTGTEGPLVPGEVERAAAWGRDLAAPA